MIQIYIRTWNYYYIGFKEIKEKGLIEIPTISRNCMHNAHMFYLKVYDLEVRSELLEHLKSNDIWSVFHYVPLHSAKAGLNFGRFDGVDQFTTKESERVIRLPMYYGINENELAKIVSTVIKFFR